MSSTKSVKDRGPISEVSGYYLHYNINEYYFTYKLPN